METLDYVNLKRFWDNAFKVDESDLNNLLRELEPSDYLNLAPSKKLYDAASSLKGKELVLDFGAGTGWASIIMAKDGTKKVECVDTSKNGIELAKTYAKGFDVYDNIEFKVIGDDFLNNEETNKYDAIFTSNVFDVIPINVTENLLKEMKRITKSGATIIVGLNYFLDLDKIKSSPREKVDKPYFFMDGILRLTSLSDDDWKKLFSKYFKVEKIDHFAWHGEEKERRRLFFLKNE